MLVEIILPRNGPTCSGVNVSTRNRLGGERRPSNSFLCGGMPYDPFRSVSTVPHTRPNVLQAVGRPLCFVFDRYLRQAGRGTRKQPNTKTREQVKKPQATSSSTKVTSIHISERAESKHIYTTPTSLSRPPARGTESGVRQGSRFSPNHNPDQVPVNAINSRLYESHSTTRQWNGRPPRRDEASSMPLSQSNPRHGRTALVAS